MTEESNQDATAVTIQQGLLPNEWLLPGFGESKNCGKAVPILICECCMKIHYVLHRCNQKTCKKCWEIWHVRTTKKIKSRICSQKAGIKNHRKKIKHVVVTPTPEHAQKYNYWELREQAIDYLSSKSYIYAVQRYDQQKIRLEKYGFLQLKKSYIITQEKFKELTEEDRQKIRKHFLIKFSSPSGSLIFHPFRLKPEAQEEYKEYLRNASDGMKKWEWIRSKPNWRELVIYSPHFHFIGYIGFLAPAKSEEMWLYKTIKDGNKVAILSDKDVFRAVNYLLTHTGVLDDRNVHSYVWIGTLSTRNGKFSDDTSADADPMDMIMNDKSGSGKSDAKINKECRWCAAQGKRGKLRYIWKTFRACLHAHDIYICEDPNLVEWEHVIKEVKQLDIENHMKLHLLEAIKVRQRKPPPLGFEEYIIEYNE